MPALGWKCCFDESIKTPDGGRISTQQAIAFLANEIPKSEHGMAEVQAAAQLVTEAAENNGPTEFTRISMMQAINRHRRRVSHARYD